jgi:hypothetical protein
VEDLGFRLILLINVVVPLVLFMAAMYLGLHIAFAALIARPESPVLWFFSVVTGPLTRPVRAMLPPSTPETRVRAIALAVYVGLWLGVRVVFAAALGVGAG